MRLSSFNLSWYARWPISHTALDEWSRPGLTNGLGSLQAAGDPTSIRHVLFPPVSGGEESTAYLTLNGTFLAATSLQTSVTWRPWAIDRETTHDGWQVASTLTMPPDVHAVLQRIQITNTADVPRPLTFSLRLSGRCVNRGVEKWYWGVPGVATTLAGLLESTGLDPLTERLSHGLITQERPPAPPATDPHAGRAWNAQLLSPAPHEWARNGDAAWSFASVAPGETVTVHLSLGLGETRAEALEPARALLAEPAAAFTAAEVHWLELWRSAFMPDGPRSGSLPDLVVPDHLAPVAASSILSLLQARRTHRVTDGKTFYNISTPRRVEACFYPNDWSMTARSLAQLDPEPTWRQLAMALRADVRKYNQINFITGRGGDAIGPGWPYTVDIYNAFYAAWQLWQTNDHADPATLTSRTFTTPVGELTLLGVLENLAFDWRAHRVESLGLADYGSKHELLECVSTYEHVVAALNAAAVWMLRRLTDAYSALGRTADATAARNEADALRDALIKHLYVEGCGWFRCLQPDGRAREVRHCWDTGMVLMCIGPELPARIQEDIVRFFQTELQTPGWIRALSPHDGDAAVSGLRADHQFNGAFGSWPAEVALGLVRIGRHQLVKDWFAGIARTARQGPFGQAYYDEGVYPPTHGGATKVTEELPQCCHWSNISGGLFFTVLEELYPTT